VILPVKIKLLRPTSQLPRYMTAGAAACDVYADLYGDLPYNFKEASRHCFRIHQWETIAIPLGFALEMDPEFHAVIKTRSGSAKKGIELHFATIDPDFRGECHALVHGGPEGIRIEHGDRIGQMLFLPVYRAEFEQVEELSQTVRGGGGLGSTGVR
jgi:dUTP pyrophosphatase